MRLILFRNYLISLGLNSNITFPTTELFFKMKFLVSQVTYFLSRRESRRNIGGLAKYILFLFAMIVIFSILFHFLMIYEGREFSWFSGFYWTLTVMTTLGFGDITFHSDLGRIFSVIVMLSGVVFLLIMLPFTFIQSFYAPWLEAQLHASSPREVPPETKDHVIICNYDAIAPNLIKRLKLEGIPYFVIESDANTAAQLVQDGVSVIYGNFEGVSTFIKMNADKARLIFANVEDTVNTNIVLTAREIAPNVPIAATCESFDSVDILELSGANYVLPLKNLLGQKLANRINIGKNRANIIGKFAKWQVVELSVQDTQFEGLKLSETNLRENSGINIIGVWQNGKLQPPRPEMILSDSCVAVGVGTKKQVDKLNSLIKTNYEPQNDAVLIIGGGKVGRAAGRALKEKNLKVFVIDAKKELQEKIERIPPERLTIGNAADRNVLEKGGLNEVSLVILSTNQDAVNIYLSIYCRKLNPDLRIVSRITYARNREAIHRAGADLVLSYAPLGAESVMSIILGREPVILGEGVEFFRLKLPKSLRGKTLSEAQIGTLTGLVVIGVEIDGKTEINLTPDYILPKDSKLSILGTAEQIKVFEETFKE